ncbi:DUF4257 domain-containing protein [Peribacillus frigoritolerans]|uniref:DUF4257 domain-containing protein n=1 Tax=Peribacillus frigoritolerans TaxID=450367 RepID=UPI00105A4445|nr:DUF4257 domain-containing protein [Peribacillus frigoritolerans]TDL76429.1 DUF4257 domain-containing protein [Peribacillus frigoritolerans]
MLQTVVVASLIGGLMGLLGHIKKKGRIEKPRMTKRFIYLGFWEDIAMGMTASILLVLSTEPSSSFQLVVLSIIAGYSGEAVLRSFDFVRQQQDSAAQPEKDNERQAK